MNDHPGYGSAPTEGEESKRRFRRWPIVVAFALILLLVGAAFGAYAYDDSRKNEIAEGVTIGGVDVGGLEAEEAEDLLRAQLIKPLKQPIRVTYNGRTWKLRAKQLKIRADIERSVERAIAVSQEGGLPGRLVRYVTGGTVDENIKPSVGYSQPAINRLVRRIAGDVNRDPVNASVSPSATSLNVVNGKPGKEVRDNLLTDQLNAMVRKRGGNRTVRLVVRTTKPEISTNEVAQEYPTYLTVSQSEYTVRLWKNLELVASYPIAVGQPAYPTPYGLFSIESKQVDPVWSVPNSDWAGELAGTTVAGGTAANPLKARWMGVTDGVGFHGTSEDYSIGTAASHGCMRMHVSDIIALYDQVPVGTPVYIG